MKNEPTKPATETTADASFPDIKKRNIFFQFGWKKNFSAILFSYRFAFAIVKTGGGKIAAIKALFICQNIDESYENE